MRIAMWSGPRNLSTAMMYAFATRADCAAVDEPFYAAYLGATGLDHPMRERILAAQPVDPGAVVAGLLRPVAQPVQYLKLMTHHMLPGFPLDWARDAANIHLIRHPARVIASYAAKRDAPDLTLEDIGFGNAAQLFAALPGPVIDSDDIRAQPGAMLETLCDSIGLRFDPAMLSWPAGPKQCDGVWAPHWYDAVHRSTGFARAEGALPQVEDRHRPLLDRALPVYEAMRAARLRP